MAKNREKQNSGFPIFEVIPFSRSSDFPPRLCPGSDTRVSMAGQTFRRCPSEPLWEFIEIRRFHRA